MRRSILALMFALAAASVSAQEERRGDAVSFELKRGHAYVQMELNGKGGYTFIFDTGAARTVLHPRCAESLGFRIGEPRSPTPVRLDRIALGKAVIRGMEAVVQELPHFEAVREYSGVSVDGILGYTFIARFVTTIDYRARILTLVPSEHRPDDGEKRSEGPVWIGLSPRALGADEANEIGIDGGVVVQKTAKNSPAERGGLREKDIVQEIDGRRILSMDDYEAALRKARPDDVLVFRVIRDRKDVELRITVTARK